MLTSGGFSRVREEPHRQQAPAGIRGDANTVPCHIKHVLRNLVVTINGGFGSAGGLMCVQLSPSSSGVYHPMR